MVLNNLFKAGLSGGELLGIGFDVCSQQRIASAWKRFGIRFLDRLYTQKEQIRALRLEKNYFVVGVLSQVDSSQQKKEEGRLYKDFTQPQQAAISARLARLFAAKEATAKALGTGISQGVTWCDMEILHHPTGAPYLRLHNTALNVLHTLNNSSARQKDAGIALYVTMSSEHNMAYALVLLQNTKSCSVPSTPQSHEER